MVRGKEREIHKIDKNISVSQDGTQRSCLGHFPAGWSCSSPQCRTTSLPALETWSFSDLIFQPPFPFSPPLPLSPGKRLRTPVTVVLLFSLYSRNIKSNTEWGRKKCQCVFEVVIWLKRLYVPWPHKTECLWVIPFVAVCWVWEPFFLTLQCFRREALEQLAESIAVSASAT